MLFKNANIENSACARGTEKSGAGKHSTEKSGLKDIRTEDGRFAEIGENLAGERR